MYVVTFENYVPAPRFTGTPWTQVLIEEAALSTGPWTQIDVQSFDPLDTDPEEPMGRDFTTEVATLEQGWYRVITADAAGSQSQPSEPRLNAPNYVLPTTRDVADKLYLRTVTRGNVYLGHFDEELTSPKDAQVQRYIEQAFDEVYGRIDVIDNLALVRKARETITLYAAMTVEQSHYPEQIRAGRSAYPEFKALFDKNMEVLTAAAGPVVDDPTGISSGTPNYGFPETSIGDGVMP